ncbi:hypothetical protein FHG87_019302 [Trinorchestia longiramus]|nr:hypothetical protein FHG87_019302 [Trinorchestia longiramus]
MNTNSLHQHANGLNIQKNNLNIVMTTPNPKLFRLEVTDKIGDHHVTDFALQVHDPDDMTQLKTTLNYKRASTKLMKEEHSSFDYVVTISDKIVEECFMIKNRIFTATEHLIQ